MSMKCVKRNKYDKKYCKRKKVGTRITKNKYATLYPELILHIFPNNPLTPPI